eukprot:TRINITY_DN382_c0_g1_i1.p1 TRINITY_DN382_c0_g1~~TRINITY_DN382_c0_g1_i1.p1  ORF type:complete len:253 (+),score=56.80 TRINITY_DN382_c0_g1_i1:579-1337(+)
MGVLWLDFERLESKQACAQLDLSASKTENHRLAEQLAIAQAQNDHLHAELEAEKTTRREERANLQRERNSAFDQLALAMREQQALTQQLAHAHDTITRLRSQMEDLGHTRPDAAELMRELEALRLQNTLLQRQLIELLPIARPDQQDTESRMQTLARLHRQTKALLESHRILCLELQYLSKHSHNRWPGSPAGAPMPQATIQLQEQLSKLLVSADHTWPIFTTPSVQSEKLRPNYDMSSPSTPIVGRRLAFT